MNDEPEPRKAQRRLRFPTLSLGLAAFVLSLTIATINGFYALRGSEVIVQQPRSINRSIDLRRRETSVAEQLLKRTQVRPTREEMRCETVAKCVWRKAFRQTKPVHHNARSKWMIGLG